jgi:hypothetical protein
MGGVRGDAKALADDGDCISSRVFRGSFIEEIKKEQE